MSDRSPHELPENPELHQQAAFENTDADREMGLADRPAAAAVEEQQREAHTYAPDDEVARQRALFEQKQREIQASREGVAETIEEVSQRVGEEYERAIHDPEHQRFVQEQLAHQEVDEAQLKGGKEVEGDDVVTRAMPGNVEAGRQVPLPTTPIQAEEFNNED